MTIFHRVAFRVQCLLHDLLPLVLSMMVGAAVANAVFDHTDFLLLVARARHVDFTIPPIEVLDTIQVGGVAMLGLLVVAGALHDPRRAPRHRRARVTR